MVYNLTIFIKNVFQYQTANLNNGKTTIMYAPTQRYYSYIRSYFSLFLTLLLAVLDPRCHTGFSLVVASGGYSPVVVCRLLIAVASLVEVHGL